MNITRCSIISRRRADGARAFLTAVSAEKERNRSKKRKKHHMPDVRRAYDAYEAYEVWKGLFLTPSTACGRSPSLEDGGLGGLRARSKPRIQPRVQGRDPARFKGGYGVPRGFKGEKSKFPPNPLGLAERVYSFHRPRGGSPPSKREVLGLRRSRPSAFPSIAYRGFAVAPITLRASSRSLLYNPGCRVATLLVSMGVMGFLGDLRGRNRNLPLIP